MPIEQNPVALNCPFTPDMERKLAYDPDRNVIRRLARLFDLEWLCLLPSLVLALRTSLDPSPGIDIDAMHGGSSPMYLPNLAVSAKQLHPEW